MPIASTRFCIRSLIIVPPLEIVISPTRNMPSSRKIGPNTKCMYFCKKIETTGIDRAVVVSRAASARYRRQRPSVYSRPALMTGRVLPTFRATYEIAAMLVANGQGLIEVSRPR